MKISRPIILSGSLCLISLVLYGAVSENGFSMNSTENKSSDLSRKDQAGVVGAALSLQEEIALMRSELAEVRKGIRRKSGTQKDIQSLQSEIADIRELLAGIGRESIDEKDASESSPVTEEESIDAQKAQAQERYTAFNKGFDDDYIDPQWSLEMTTTINQAFNAVHLSGTEVTEVECHSSLCRVEVFHNDHQAINEFVHQFPIEVAQALPRINYHYKSHEDGSVSMVAFLARQGYEFPNREEYNNNGIQWKIKD